MHFAVVQGRKDIVLLLIKEGANINVKGEHGYTPLHEAIEQNHEDIANIFISADNIDLRVKNNDGLTAMELAGILNLSP